MGKRIRLDEIQRTINGRKNGECPIILSINHLKWICIIKTKRSLSHLVSVGILCHVIPLHNRSPTIDIRSIQSVVVVIVLNSSNKYILLCFGPQSFSNVVASIFFFSFLFSYALNKMLNLDY